MTGEASRDIGSRDEAGRRAFLRKAGATSVATAVGVLAVPSPPDFPGEDALEGPAPDAAGARDDGTNALPWDEPIESEAASPIARYQYAPDRGTEGGYHRTSPINVVVLLGDPSRSLEDVLAVLADAGWIRRPEEYARYAWDRRAETYVLQEATAAETYYGTSGRCHVRCWEFEGVVSIQAHADTSARPKHGIASYERARARVETAFAADGWSVAPAAVDLANRKRPDHDGLATIVRPGGRRD